MSFGAPQSGPTSPGEPGPAGTKPNASVEDLHALAVDVQTDLQTLATGLAHSGAAPPAVAALTHMAGILSGVVKVLGSAGAQAEQAPPQHEAPPPQHEAPPQQQASPQPQMASPPHAALGQAVAALHEGMQASAQRRAMGAG